MQHKLRPTVFLTDEEWAALSALAEKEQRDPSRQASYMLLLAIRGMVDTKPNEADWLDAIENFRKGRKELEEIHGPGVLANYFDSIEVRFAAGDRSDELYEHLTGK
jgi:transposase